MDQRFRQAGMVVAIALLGSTVFAQRGGGGARGGGGGGAARTSVNRGGGSYGGSANVNRSGNVNANRNVNVNQNVNVNRNVNVHGGGCCYGGGYDYGHYHPVARGVAFGVAAVGTAAVIGSIVNTLPSSCTTIVNAGVTYQQCGSTWYKPQYSGTSTTYVVVNPP